jgi:hypothetical protein
VYTTPVRGHGDLKAKKSPLDRTRDSVLQASIKRPVLVPVSAHGSANDRFSATLRRDVLRRSKLLRRLIA